MQNKTIEQMAPLTKEWFAKAIVGMILADGRIDKAELKYLNDLIGFLKDESLVNTITTMLERNEMPTLDPVEPVTNEALEIVKHLTIMAVVDEDLANREVRFLKYATDQLGLSPEIPERFLSLAKEKLKRVKYMARATTKEFSEQVKCFDLTEDGCMFYSYHKVPSNIHVALQLYKESEGKNALSPYQIVDAESTWSRPVQSKFGNFVVGVTFINPLKSEQGLELIEHAQPEEDNL